MLSKVYSASVQGIDGRLITVEVDIARGLPALSIVGLPDTSVKEAKNRVVSAIRNSGFDVPAKKITVNLAPGYIKKEGPSFDLPIAVGILAACNAVDPGKLDGFYFLGELALDGSLRPVRGILPIVLSLGQKKMHSIILPSHNKNEAAVAPGIEVFPADSLRQVADFLNGHEMIFPYELTEPCAEDNHAEPEMDFTDIKGQQFAKRALEIAAAGGHNVLLVGPPGSGKTMLARRLAGILPEFTREEALETTRIYSVAGLMEDERPLMQDRPYRAPHHSISDIALIGGGQHPRPGEISLAHHGVLFLDELPEFHRNVLEVMRQPMEDGYVRIARAAASQTYPACFMLVAAMNPCPCGYYGHPEKECLCTPYAIQKYRGKISGPLLDRIDMHIEVPALRLKELTSSLQTGERSADIRRRVQSARDIQRKRFGSINACLTPRQIKKICAIDQESRILLEKAISVLGLSARAYDRILKISRTIADLEDSRDIRLPHVAEAVQYRCLDRRAD